MNHDWVNAVLGRLENCNDLVAIEAIFNSTCLAKFKMNKSMTGKKAGPPEFK